MPFCLFKAFQKNALNVQEGILHLQDAFLCFCEIPGGRKSVLNNMDLYDRADTINELLARYGVKFGIYKNN